MYRVEFSPRAKKELAHLPLEARLRVAADIDALAGEPRPAGCKPLRTAPQGTYRIRVGRYRVVYLVRDDLVLVMVMRVTKRDESTYRELG